MKSDTATERFRTARTYINACGVQLLDVVLLEDIQDLVAFLCAESSDASGTEHN
jgi:hypothetical protein